MGLGCYARMVDSMGGRRSQCVGGMDKDDKAMTAKDTAERQRTFRQFMKAAGFVKLEAYVTLEQRDKFRALGGDKWLRKRIDAAKC